MMIERDYVELLIGRGKCPLEHPDEALVDYVDHFWIIALANFYGGVEDP